MRTLIKAMIAAAVLTAATSTGTAAHACGFGCDDDSLLIAIALSGDDGWW